MQRQCKHAAMSALRAFREVHGTDTNEADATDLISDLLLMLQEKGEDAAAILRMATGHFVIEAAEAAKAA